MDESPTSQILFAGDMRRALGINLKQFEFIMAMHPELEPPRSAGRRLFTQEHVEKFRAILRAREERRAQRAREVAR